jgi:hypothetical protein
MRRNGFRFAGSLQHEELRQDCNSLEPDGESPEDLSSVSAHPDRIPVPATHLGKRVFVWEQYRQYRAGSDQILHLECVQVRIVGRLVVVEHEVDGVRGGADKDDLEDGVVQRLALVEGPEEIDVSRYVYDEVEEL